MNFAPGSAIRISSRSVIVCAAALFCLYFYYHTFSVTKDPLTASTIAAAVAAFDRFAHWLDGGDDSEVLRNEIKRLKQKCGEA